MMEEVTTALVPLFYMSYCVSEQDACSYAHAVTVLYEHLYPSAALDLKTTKPGSLRLCVPSRQMHTLLDARY